MSKKQTIFVAIDIEKAGASMGHHPIVSAGFVVGDANGEILETLKVNCRAKWPVYNLTGENEYKLVDYGHFEKRCWDEFWAKNPAIIPLCLENPAPLPKAIAWGAEGPVCRFLNDLEKKYPETDYKIRFLSDNPSFDIGHIDYELMEEGQRLPLRYTSDGKYRGISDPTEMLEGLPATASEAIWEEAKLRSSHNHDPVSDATHIYWLYILVQRWKLQQQQ